MVKTILHVKNCIAEITNFLPYMMVWIVIITLFDREKPNYFTLSAMVVVPLYFYLVRVLLHRVWLYSLAHLFPLYMIWLIFIGNPSHIFIFLASAIIQMCLSLGAKSAANNMVKGEHGIKVIMPLIVILLAAALYLQSYDSSIVVLMIIFIILYFVHLHLVQFLAYTEVNRLITGIIPEKSIFGSSIIIVSFFILAVVFLMISAAGWSWLSALGRWLVDLVNDFLESFQSAQVMDFLPQDDFEHLSTIPPEIIEAANNEFGEKPWIMVLGFLAYAIIASLLFGAFVIFVKFLLSSTRKLTYRKSFDEVEDDIIEKIKRIKQKKKDGFRLRLFLTADEKIRRIFAKTVTRQIDYELIHASYTAREMLELFEESEHVAELIRLYEKARYARESCTEADVREAKRLKGLVQR